MKQNCKICRWGPDVEKCKRPNCSYMIMNNGEIFKRMNEDELARLLSRLPSAHEVQVWKKILREPVYDEFLKIWGI